MGLVMVIPGYVWYAILPERILRARDGRLLHGALIHFRRHAPDKMLGVLARGPLAGVVQYRGSEFIERIGPDLDVAIGIIQRSPFDHRRDRVEGCCRGFETLDAERTARRFSVYL